MCGGDFLSKNPDEAMDFLNYVAETSKGWDEPNPREIERMKPTVNPRGGIYALTEDVELKAKLSTLNRRMEELEQRNHQEVRAVAEASMPSQPCFNCQSTGHQGEHCPISPPVRDLMVENANVVGQNRPPNDARYGNTYNPNWKNHPNLAWKPKPPVYVPLGAQQQQQYGSTSQQQQPPTSSPVEQAIMNLSKVVGSFVVEQKTINAQINQRIEKVERSIDKRIVGLHKSLNKKIDTMQSSINSLNNQQQVQEKGRFPSQTLPNPRGVHELSFLSELAPKMDEVQAVITLRSGKEIEQPVSKPVGKTREQEGEEPEHIFIKEDSMKESMLPPFPQALRSKKKASKQEGILEVLRQVKVNIPLLDMIKQVPTYAKFLKDLCTVKKGLGINKKAFLTEQVSSIIQCKTLLKYKGPGSPTISVNIGGTYIDKALLDLGANVNLLPYSMYKQLGLGELKPTNIIVSLVDRSVKIPKGIVEDVLVKVDNFYYPVDFVVLDTEPMADSTHQVPIILGRPFLATANAIINCRNGVMQLTFGNMNLELNIFHLSNKDKPAEDKEQKSEEVCLSGTGDGKLSAYKLQEESIENKGAVDEGSTASVTHPASVMPLATTASFTASQSTLAERMTRTEASIAQIQASIVRLESHLGLPAVSPQAPAQTSAIPPQSGSVPPPSAPATSLDVLAAATTSATSPTAPQPAQAEDEPSPTTD